MRNTIIASLLFPLIASLSFSLNAAPVAAQTPPPVQQTVGAVMDAQQPGINLNQADAQTLQSALNGIGKTKAEAIVAYREANGPFTSVDELLEVKGIGKALLDRNREKIILE
jgi:competence protein ComEA